MHKTMKRYLLAVAIGIAAGGAARADVVVVPNANTATPGTTDNRFPFLVSGGMRYQQVYAASQFALPTAGPKLISELDLRNGVLVNEAFSSTISNIQISLSTVSLAPDALSSTFASNIGADVTQVYNGSLTLSSTNAAGPGGTHVFDIAIVFQTPFLYDPAAGNLLLDVKNISGANAAVGSDFFDAVSPPGDSVSRVWGDEGSPNATTGNVDSLGLISQFQFTSAAAVPEPSQIALTALASVLFGVPALLRRRARKQGNDA
jgi:hypothetical protein